MPRHNIGPNQFEIPKPEFFDLDITMDSEQCPVTFFFWKRIKSGKYSRLCQKGDTFYKLTLSQTNEKLLVKLQPQKGQQLNTAIHEHAEKLIQRQFRFDDDLNSILESIKQWPEIKELLNFAPGLRLVRSTELFPTICDAICSQNSSIVQLDKIMQNISEGFGEQITFDDGSQYYTFPSPQVLAQVSLLDLQKCKLGYRAKYLHKSSGILVETLDKWKELDLLPLEVAKSKVECLPGVGPKVGALILMFCYDRTDVFPVDVWIGRGLSSLYGWQGDASILQKRAEKKFLELSSYVSNILFYVYRRGLYA